MSNPNETILIPLLNKRVAELLSQNIMLEAKSILLEQEKEALLKQANELAARIAKLEAAEGKKRKKDAPILDGSTY
jgi:hypothetical protein